MTLYDLPLIDDGAKASSESVIKVRGQFIEKNGYISREEYPDKGIDLEVELIIDSQFASGKKFPIQIKSDSNINIVTKKGKKYIYFEFQTSRLGYLCRRAPVYGLIIIYDEKNKKIFFDFVEDIVSRETQFHKNEEWKMRDNVNIHIPIENEINEKLLKEIHQKFSNRFDAIDMMIEEHGVSYGIPNVSLFKESIPESIDLDNLNEIINFLNKYGQYLIDPSYVNNIYLLLQKIPVNEINKSPKLMLLCCFTFNKIGLYIEADYYIKKCNQFIDKFSRDEINLLKIVQYHTDFLLGKFDPPEYLEKLNSLSSEIKDEINQIFIKMQILYLEILTYKRAENTYPDLIRDINIIFKELEQSSINSDLKHVLNLTLCDNIHMIAMRIYIHYGMILQMKERLGIVTSVEKRIELVNEVMSLIDASEIETQKSFKYAKENNNDLIKAHSAFNLSSHFFTMEFFSYQMEYTSEKVFERNKDLFIQNFKFALISYELFKGLTLYHESLKSLEVAYELQVLFKLHFKEEFGILNNNKIKEIINEIGKQMGFNEFNSLVDRYVKDRESFPKSPEEFFFNIDEADFETVARDMLTASDLPHDEDRIKNLIDEIKGLKLFYENRYCKNLVLLVGKGHLLSKTTAYKDIPDYKIICKICEQETVNGPDVLFLLELLSKEMCIEKED